MRVALIGLCEIRQFFLTRSIKFYGRQNDTSILRCYGDVKYECCNSRTRLLCSSGQISTVQTDNKALMSGLPLMFQINSTSIYFLLNRCLEQTSKRIRSISTKRLPLQWETMFECLQAYKAKHGDTLVPAEYRENPPLGTWVDNNRQMYRMRLQYETLATEGKPIPPNMQTFRHIMTDEKIEALQSIGFVWNVSDHLWNSKYKELLDFYREHGHTLIPFNYEKNISLGIWVLKQRRNFKVKEEQRKKNGANKFENEVSLSQDRVQKLNEIGFVWDYHEAFWLERLNELRKYRVDHGSTLVPKKCPEYPLLGTWVSTQRTHYKRYVAMKKLRESEGQHQNLESTAIDDTRNAYTGMTEEKIRLLEAEGFIWNHLGYLWELKYEELRDSIALNGHNIFYEKEGRYNSLSRWIRKQRENYRKYLKGEKTTLTEEKIERLNSIGFVYEPPIKLAKRTAKSRSKKQLNRSI